MGLFKRKRDSPERRELDAKTADFIRGVDVDFNGANSGVNVDELKAMQTSAVYACVKILAETVASLPLQLFKEESKTRLKATQHPLYNCLYALTNEEILTVRLRLSGAWRSLRLRLARLRTSFQFREVMILRYASWRSLRLRLVRLRTSVLLYGNAYARIVKKQSHVVALWYLKPENMVVERDRTTQKIKYTYNDEDSCQSYVYNSSQIFHLKGLSLDGVKGLSPIAEAREAVGLALATEAYGAKFFGNGARPGGVLEHPGIIKDPEKLRESWNSVYQGSQNSHKIAVLEEGIKYHSIGIPPEEAQFLQTRKYQLNEICRIFRGRRVKQICQWHICSQSRKRAERMRPPQRGRHIW